MIHRSVFNKFQKFLRKLLVKRSVLAIRGYQRLKRNNNTSIVARVKYRISETLVEGARGRVSKYIFRENINIADLLIRQYLSIRVGGLGLSKSILIAFGGGAGIHILPAYLLKILKDEGVKVDYLKSLFCWRVYIFLIWAYGVQKALKLVLRTFPFPAKKIQKRTKSAFFLRIIQGNLPCSSNLRENYDLLSWYIKWEKRDPNITSVFHGIQPNQYSEFPGISIISGQSVFCSSPSVVNWLKFIFWAVCACFISLMSCFTKSWWNAFLLAEAVKAACMESLDQDHIAAEYWFSHTGYMYRPIWTYVAERRGAKIYMYFYSVNNNAIKKLGDSDAPIGTWNLMNWPNYIVWNENQREFVKSFAHDPKNILVVDDLPFSDSETVIEVDHNKIVAVFDVQPHRALLHALQAQAFEFYNPQNCIKFLCDIEKIATSQSLMMILKRKRHDPRYGHRSYAKVVEQMIKKAQYITYVDPKTSPHKAILAADIAISIPFTSTAIIARNMGKPSCYYDPTGLLNPSDPNADGIPIIQGTPNLKRWIITNI